MLHIMKFSKSVKAVFILLVVVAFSFCLSNISDDDDLRTDFVFVLPEAPFDHLPEYCFFKKSIFGVQEQGFLPTESNILYLEMHETSPPAVHLPV